MFNNLIKQNAESILKDGDTSVITMTVQGTDLKKLHYYFFKVESEIENNTHIAIPIKILTEEKGKGKNRHYNIVAVYKNGYVVFSLNKKHTIACNYGSPINVGLPFEEAEEIVKF